MSDVLTSKQELEWFPNSDGRYSLYIVADGKRVPGQDAVGLLGLINGYAGLIPDGKFKGWGPVAALVERDGRCSGFIRADSAEKATPRIPPRDFDPDTHQGLYTEPPEKASVVCGVTSVLDTKCDLPVGHGGRHHFGQNGEEKQP